MKQIILPFIIAWLSGMLLVPLVRKAAIKLGLVDRPNNRKIHKSPIPRVGGVALFLGSLIGALPFLKENSATLGVLLASAFIFVIGLIDDLIDLKPRVKLAAQIIACFVLFMFGVKINIVTDFIAGQGFVSLGLLTYPLTLLWIIGLTNTVNLVDGVDGLAGGIVFIALSTLLTVRLMIPQVQDPALMSNVLVISASTMGVLLAFLKYNVFPASIFMGDSGAYFLGFVTAALSVAGGAKGSILFPLIVPLIAFGLPVFDVLFAIMRRFFQKSAHISSRQRAFASSPVKSRLYSARDNAILMDGIFLLRLCGGIGCRHPAPRYSGCFRRLSCYNDVFMRISIYQEKQ
jgi:UDP-GlcNAc:undecaprenyl-phosphate GlcNAc-1-phosphate transferase